MGAALLIVFGRPRTWTRLGLVFTGAGFAVVPDWWQYVSGFGLLVCPAIAEILEQAEEVRRQRAVNPTADS